MPVNITPNMGLIEPVVGQEPGPTWASDLNASLGILDQHNHSAGQGIQITPAGLNINSDLAIAGNNLTTVKTVNFQAQLSSLPGTTPNLGCIYVAGKELYYNDEVGNVVPITANGSVNAGAGSITGLPSGTASASYSSITETFVWQSATSTPANMDAGSYIFRNIVASSKGLTLNPPNAMAADYSLTLPVVPAQTNVMTLDASGNMGSITYDQVGVDMTATGANAIVNTNTTFPITQWATYTPTLVGYTASAVSFIWRQVGKSVEVMGQITATGTTASIFSISLPGSYTILSSLPAIYPMPVGLLYRQVSGALFNVNATAGASVVNAGTQASDPTVNVSGNTLGGNNILVNFSVPVN